MIPYVMSATFRECAKYVKAQPMKMKMPPMIIVSRQLNTLIRRLAIGPEWTKTRLINLEIIIIINTKLSPHIYIHYFICLYIEYFDLSINIMSSGVCTYIYHLRIRYSRIHNFWFTEFLIIYCITNWSRIIHIKAIEYHTSWRIEKKEKKKKRNIIQKSTDSEHLPINKAI